MQVSKRILSTILLSSLLCVSTHVTNSRMNIYSDSSLLDHAGYGNGEMRTNGEELVIKEIIKPNMRIFDVGANVGEWTSKVLHYFPTTCVYAFEPIPAVYTTLKNRLHAHNVNFFNIAFSSVQGVQEFQYYPSHSVMSGLVARPCLLKILHEAPELIEVNTNTLDHFCVSQGIEQIDFLKIDTEGAELVILQGAEQLLRNHKITYIQFEYGGTYADSQTTLQEAYRLLTSCNYKVYRIIPDGLIHITQWRDALETYCYSNYLAVAE